MKKKTITNKITPGPTAALMERLQTKAKKIQSKADDTLLMENVKLFSSNLKGNTALTDTFTKVYLKNKGDWSVIQAQLSGNKNFSKETLAGISFTFKLMAWTGGNQVLIDAFRKDNTLNSMRDVALHLNRQDLYSKITDVVIPASQTKETFIDHLYVGLYVQEPTAVIINMINDPKVLLWNNELGKTISAILTKMPEFNIRETSVYELMGNEAIKKIIAKNKAGDVAGNLKALQRVTLISPSPEAIPALINNNYLSAYTIALLPPAQFIASMKATKLPPEMLQHIYAEAGKKKAVYEHLLIAIKEAGKKTGVAMIDRNGTAAVNVRAVDPEVVKILSGNNLSWDLLFGEANFCACGECNSVYSAAAYYVDLLQYLRNNNLELGKVKINPADIANTPLAKLFARRPDLGHLELSCKNTNTVLPYIDLVNEVLEQYVAFKVKDGNFENYQGFNIADEISSDLLTAPRHTEQEHAYQALQNTLFPFSLPYNQPIDAARTYLKRLDTSRHELMDTFRSNDTGTVIDNALAAEFLGLTEEEYGAVTGERFDGQGSGRRPEEYYGLENVANWQEKLSLVKDEFLPRTGIQYKELIDILQTEYINKSLVIPEYAAMLNSLSQPFSEAMDIYEDDMGGDLSGLYTTNPDLKSLLSVYDEDTKLQKLRSFFRDIANCTVLNSASNNCSLDDVTLVHYDNSLPDDDDYIKFNRFIRLWRKLGLTIDETDKIIMALGAGVITPGLIRQSATLKKIMERTGIEPVKLLCLWTNIGTAGEKALFKRLFPGVNPMVADHAMETVMAAINLSAHDISLINAYKSVPEVLPFTLEHLSLLYRYRLLSKAIGLTISAFIKLLEATGDAFENTDATLRFLENMAEFEQAGLKLNDISFVVNGTSGIGNSAIISKKEVVVLAKKIHDELTAIEKDNANLPVDVNSAEPLSSVALIRSKAALLFDADRVEHIISVLEGTTLYSTSAPVLAEALDLPANLGGKLKYVIDSSAPEAYIQIRGTLTSTELSQLKAGVKNTDAGYTAWIKSITEIEKLQLKLFNDLLAGIMVANPAEQAILKSEDNAASAPIKRMAFMRVFLPYLREKLNQKYIEAVFSEQTGLSRSIIQTLLTNILEKNGISLYHLLSPPAVPPSSENSFWYGKLIPSTEDGLTFVVRCNAGKSFRIILDNLVMLEHTGTSTNEMQEFRSMELRLTAGRVYQLSLVGIMQEELYWTTKTSSVERVPENALLPDFRKKATRTVLESLGRIAVVVKQLSMSADELNYIHAHRSDFNGINFNALSHYHLLRLVRYCKLRNSLPQSGINILQFWQLLADTHNNLGDLIVHLTKWRREDVDKLIGSRHFNLVRTDFKNEKGLLKLQNALVVSSNIGADIDRLFEWAVPAPGFDAAKAIANGVLMTLQARYHQADRQQVLKPLNDHLRKNQKNALIAYLLQQPELKAANVKDAEGLFEYFLIDVQMETCMETSRIKQAISSVQLFIQRCLLGLEEHYSGILPDVLDRDRWEWMKHYRVWEANRKVFLYPENWIESNLRDDKSPFFKELESELLQKDINRQNVTDALKAYLYKVDEVANMEVVGLCIEGDKMGGAAWTKGAKLHVFSRTRNAPYFFYYRHLCLDEMNWQPWEKMQVDIPGYDVADADGKVSANGCYLIPMVWNNRLLVFLPQLADKTRANTNVSGKVSDMSEIDQNKLRSIVYREIKMGYSEYKNGKWTQKQLSDNALFDDTAQVTVTSSVTSIFNYDFYPEILSDGSVRIRVNGKGDGLGLYEIGAFGFDGSHLKMVNGGQEDQQYSDRYFGNEIEYHLENYDYYFEFYRTAYDSAHRESSKIQLVNRPSLVFKWIPDSSTGTEENYPFFLSNQSALTRLGNSSDLKSLFEYNLSVRDSAADNAFGRSMQSVYHELKRPYALYNWELFFHTPLMIADALSKAQQFEEAMKWFHYVFNPLVDGPEDNRFWQFSPFRETDGKNILSHIFNTLRANEPDAAINEWRNNPFQPHLVARSRPVAYMKWVVMKYIDNILDWGDYLFRQDTIESINQATQLYVLAGHVLGPKPETIPKRGEVKVQTYNSLMHKWDAFSNAICELEVSAIFNIQQLEYTGGPGVEMPTMDIFGSAGALYFCIPENPKLIAYWDRLADRLFKIRHCQNIEGVYRQLPLFDPPVDPALLVKAAAQGISISGVINDLNTPMPNYRFYYLLQKAQELCNELKSLGGAMLSAIEKKDSETLSLIRARHEGTMNNLVMEIKKIQLEEAQKSLDGLLQNRKGPEARMKYYLQLIGEDPEKIPGMDTDFTELANAIDQPVDESGLRLSKYEKEDIDKATQAQDWQRGIGIVETMAGIMHLIPELFADVKPFGIGAGTKWGGVNLGNAAQAVARGLQVHASDLSFASNHAAKKGSFQRAMQDRIFQANSAGFELKQIDKQIISQQIRIDIAAKEINNQQKQIDNVSEAEDFLKNKYSNEELYTWMRGSLKTLYRQVYNLAYDLAKKAEKTYCFERSITNSNFIQASYFDSGREGLLAGELLYAGLKQLESAYQEKRGYDYEITKHISVRMLDPLALLQLKTTGLCRFDIPEVLFDMDYPGHFKRRIKSVSISIPCIVGPYTGVNATLRLLNNRFRNSSVPNDYPEKTGEQDDRFLGYNIPVTAIAASSGQNDAGMFELNFKDERYLPFEGAGVVSGWELELPVVKQFNYNTISDVILHVKYLACEGGQQLKTSAVAATAAQLNRIGQQLNETGLHLLLSLTYDMPAEWHLLKNKGTVMLGIDSKRLPYMVQRGNAVIKQVMFIAKVKDNPQTFAMKIGNKNTTLELNTELGLLLATDTAIELETSFTLLLGDGDKEQLEELALIINYEV